MNIAQEGVVLTQLCYTYKFIYLFLEFRMQPYNSKSREHNTIYAYMDTKGRMYRHLHSTNKTKKMQIQEIFRKLKLA